jgi:type II secretory pathway pseudopilin PulG
MKNKEFYKLLKKNKLNSNSGFTLIELLVGLFMSIFVIGALGFGLMTVLQTSQRENSKVKARTENSRALDFVSDEVRRARNIETNVTNAGSGFSATDKTIVLALDIPEISSSANAGVRGRIVYYLKSTGLGNWKGPQVLYRWGPPLDAQGNYPFDATTRKYDSTVAWSEEALIDGIGLKKADGTLAVVSSPCATGTVAPANPTGFYACITGANTAQLFLTGQTKTAVSTVNDSQTNDTQVVARARETLANKIDDNTSLYWSVEGLGGDYKCKDGKSWDMRTDFSNSATPDTDPNKVSWTQVPGGPQQQPQPIEIKSNLPLKLTSNPVLPTGVSVATECNSSSASVDHTINFGNPTTFNGVCAVSYTHLTLPTSGW